MSLWVFILIIIGGLLLFGVLIDLLTKKRKTSDEIQTASKNASESERIYTETLLNEARNEIHKGPIE